MDTERELRPFRNLSFAFVVFALCAAVILLAPAYEVPSLHTFFDGAAFLLAGVLALLLWDIGWRANDNFARLLAVAFAITAGFELFHVSAAIEFSTNPTEVQARALRLRPATWPPAAYILPIGVGVAYWVRNFNRRVVLAYSLGLALVGAGLFLLFRSIPAYTEPGWFGVTRPSLALVPVAWTVVGLIYWGMRATRGALGIIWLFCIFAVIGNLTMLYSKAPADDPAMLAHAAKFVNELFLLFTLTQMGTVDTARRMRAERDLTQLAEALENRVLERTVELESANTSLRAEATSREVAERKALAQLARLRLLQQTTHAIAERQDLSSIFQIVVGCLEDYLVVELACLFHYDQVERRLTVARVGAKSVRLAAELGLSEGAPVEIDENGLSRCVRGQLVYEPDIGKAEFPFPQRLARAGLRSFVAVPLLIEQRTGVFGVLVVARREVEAFSSGECEFLDQLGENVALASNQAQLHVALQRAYDDLRDSQQAIMQQERLRALGQMASGIAHDINNAISPATLYVESILDRATALDEKTRSQLETVQRAIGDVAQTVSRMGEFYRKREPENRLVPVNINVILAQVPDLTRARWSDMALARGVEIQMCVEEAQGAPTIMANESEIREALINLVFNAADAMPDGGSITLRARRQAGDSRFTRSTVIVEVHDDGDGMDEKTRHRCLEPFFTTKGERGTGLGLAMVYGIAQRHHAELQIESDIGKGTTIRLLFADSDDVPAELPDRAANSAVSLRILLIDDDPLILQALCDSLEFEGHHVTCAHGGQAGVDMFSAASDRGEPFIVVITDLGMPHVDGRQVAAAIKAKNRNTRVVMLTGWGQRLAETNELPIHVDRMLSKPPNIWALREALVV